MVTQRTSLPVLTVLQVLGAFSSDFVVCLFVYSQCVSPHVRGRTDPCTLSLFMLCLWCPVIALTLKGGLWRPSEELPLEIFLSDSQKLKP